MRNPIRLHGAHTSRIAAVREDKLVIHDRLNLLAEKAARRVDGDSLIADEGPVAAVRDQPCRVGREPGQEAL